MMTNPQLFGQRTSQSWSRAKTLARFAETKEIGKCRSYLKTLPEEQRTTLDYATRRNNPGIPQLIAGVQQYINTGKSLERTGYTQNMHNEPIGTTYTVPNTTDYGPTEPQTHFQTGNHNHTHDTLVLAHQGQMISIDDILEVRNFVKNNGGLQALQAKLDIVQKLEEAQEA